MCIALLSTAHPQYKLILLSNRDEYLSRPTAPAAWWSPAHPSVLGGRDLLRATQGTWLGLTRHGHLAVLTNYRDKTAVPLSAVSRGEIIKAFLTRDVKSENDVDVADTDADDDNDNDDVEEWARRVIETGTARDAGGFTLVCGDMLDARGLVVLSNRAVVGNGPLKRVCGAVVQTVGVSNGPFYTDTDADADANTKEDEARWPKVIDGERELLRVIREDTALQGAEVDENNNKSKDNQVGNRESRSERTRKREDEFILRLLAVLSKDSLSTTDADSSLDLQRGLEVHIERLRETILVPPLGRMEDNDNVHTNAQVNANMNIKGEDHATTTRNDEIAAANPDTDAKITVPILPATATTTAAPTPPSSGMTGVYATQKQTVILLDHHRRVRFLERTLFDGAGRPVEKGTGDVEFEFLVDRG